MTLIKLFTVTMAPEASERVARVLTSGWIAQGAEVEKFEYQLGIMANRGRRPVTVNSGTAALDLAYELIGIGKGDEVISTPMTCIATNLPLLHRQAKIVWADVDSITGLASVADIATKITERTKAIVVVDWGGRPFDLAKLELAIQSVAGRRIPVVVDAAHGLVRHRAPLSETTYVAWSFQAIKFLTTGDGGALQVPLDQHERAKRLRWFGYERRPGGGAHGLQRIEEPGFKYHMNDIAAAIGLANVGAAHEAASAARENAHAYGWRLTKAFNAQGSLDRASVLALPPKGEPGGVRDWWLYTIHVPAHRRERFVQFMARRGIECSRVHARNDTQPVFSQAYGLPHLPGVDAFDSTQVSIPVHGKLTKDEVEVVSSAVEDWMLTPEVR